MRAYHREWDRKRRRADGVPEFQLRTPEEKKANKRRWAQQNADRLNASRKKWAAANKAIGMEVVRRRQVAKRLATPAWADRFIMQEFYDLAVRRTECLGVKHAVDHIVPIINQLVCGLHCEHNLQVLTWKENRRKGNRWWPDMP